MFVKKNILKKYFIQYKPFLVFLLRFFAVYAVLAFLYHIYLNQYDKELNEVDTFTQIVAEQTKKTIRFFGYDTETEFHKKESSIKLFVEKKYVSRIVEGCNALSVKILFVAFVIAFKGRWRKMIVFILLGLILIHILNIFRIAAISIALYFYPGYEHLLHGVIFPLFIYGVVFALWVIWVTKFSLYADKYPAK